jgi:hypothetical protein
VPGTLGRATVYKESGHGALQTGWGVCVWEGRRRRRELATSLRLFLLRCAHRAQQSRGPPRLDLLLVGAEQGCAATAHSSHTAALRTSPDFHPAPSPHGFFYIIDVPASVRHFHANFGEKPMGRAREVEALRRGWERAALSDRGG